MKRPTSINDLMVSAVLESNKGGLPIMVCGCGGLFLHTQGAVDHVNSCHQMQEYFHDADPPHITVSDAFVYDMFQKEQ